MKPEFVELADVAKEGMADLTVASINCDLFGDTCSQYAEGFPTLKMFMYCCASL